MLRSTLETERCGPVPVRAEGEPMEGYVPAGCRRCKRPKPDGGQPRTLLLAEWVLMFTPLPPAVLPTATIAALYRVRWQVELVIKRLTSLLDMERRRAREQSPLAVLYLHGKLLYAAVLEKRARRRCGEDGNRVDQPCRVTPWRVWKRLHPELAINASCASTFSVSMVIVLVFLIYDGF